MKCEIQCFLVGISLFFFQSENQSDSDYLESDEFDRSSLWQKMPGDPSKPANRNSSGKFVVTVAMVESLMKNTNEKIVLVSYSTKMLDLFGEICTEKHFSFLRLDGSTPTNLRMGLVDRFNDLQGPDRKISLSIQIFLFN